MLRTSSSCCWRNSCRSTSASYSDERERVDRAHEPQLALELASPGRERGAVGDLGHRRRDRDVGLAVELAAHVLDRLLEAQADLGFFDLEPADALAHLGELLLGGGALGAQAVELGARGTGGFGLLLAAPAQAVGEALGLRRPLREPLGERVDRVALVLELRAARSRARLFVGTGRQAGPRTP